MSIVALKRITLCGTAEEKQAVLEGLQALGCLHLVPLRTPKPTLETITPTGPRNAHKALKYLLDCPRKRRPLRDDPSFDVDQVIEQALANQRRLRALSDRRDFLAKRIQDLAPWGDFRLPDPAEVGGLKLWFYVVPRLQMPQVTQSKLIWQVVHHDPRHAFVVVIARDEPAAGAMPVGRTHTGRMALCELRRQLEAAESELEDVSAERERLSRWIFLLAQNRARTEDRAALTEAAEGALDSDGIFAVQGWLPARDLKRLARFAEHHGLALLAEPPTSADNPPTLLENPRELAGGQDVVNFYRTPSYHGWDPSLTVFFSFAVFFAMILADAGYALVLGAVLIYCWRRLGANTTGRRLRILGAAIVAASTAYGVLVGSYFGVAPPPESLPGSLKRLDLGNFDTMMHLSIAVGCAHIALANAIVAYHARGLFAKLPPLGWIAVVTGGFVLWLDSSGAAPTGPLSAASPVLLTLGVGLILFFSGTGPVHTFRDAAARLFAGLRALTHASQAFGDVLSYMRLFALGLASASLAQTFNQLGGHVNHVVPGLGLLICLLLLILGHAINLGLAVLSGVVHGLRLNFIEFFNWGLSDEGYPFRAFSKQEPRT